MIVGILKRIFGTQSQRELRRMRPLIVRINELEESYQSLSEEEIRGKTAEFKARLAAGETLDDLLCEAFAVVKNVCRRLVGQEVEVCGVKLVWNMIPFDVQLMGGIALHRGNIAEMATGEGIHELKERLGAFAQTMRNEKCIVRDLVEAGDVVVLAGKGHETYQEIRGEKHPFDEKVVVRELLEEM